MRAALLKGWLHDRDEWGMGPESEGRSETQPGHWDGAWYRVRSDAFEAAFLLEPDEDPAAVENVDVLVSLRDGTTWSGTVFTLFCVQRLMDRWTRTGEALGGRYFWCPDGLITRDAGVSSMVGVISGLVASGEVQQVLKRVEADGDTDPVT